MAKTKLTATEQVTQHIQKLDAVIAPVVEALRQIIMGTDAEIGEQIKWNNPAFYYTGEMQEFDPKEYKRDIIVMNLFKGRIMLVFPSGAKVNGTTGLLEGDYKDRRMAYFSSMEEILEKKAALQSVINDWIELISGK